MKTARRSWPSTGVAALLAMLGTAAFGASGEGLTPDADGIGWSRWQGRVSLVTGAPAWRSDLAVVDGPVLKFGSARLLGDYYFSQKDFGAGAVGGFRATSGLIVGSRALPWSPAVGPAGGGISIERRVLGPTGANDSATVPYVGVGWSGASLRSGWAFSADLGVMSLNPGGAVKFGRVLGNLQNLDDVLRDLRLSPVLQLGVSYAF